MTASAKKTDAKAKTKQAPTKPCVPPPTPAPTTSAALVPFLYQRAPLFNSNNLRKLLLSCATVGVHFEFSGTNKRVVVATLQWMPKQPQDNAPILPWVVHEYGTCVADFDAFAALMRVLFTEGSAVKIVYGPTVTDWLASHGLGELLLANTVDLQLYYETHVDQHARGVSLATIAAHCGAPEVVAFNAVERKKELAKNLLAYKFIQEMIAKATVLTTCYTQRVASVTNAVQRTALCAIPARGDDRKITPPCLAAPKPVETPVPIQQHDSEMVAPLTPCIYQRAHLFDRQELQTLLESCASVGVYFDMTERNKQTNARVVVVTLQWSSESSNDAHDDKPIPAWVIHDDSATPTAFAALICVLFTEGSAIRVVSGLRDVAHWLASHGLEALPLVNTLDLQLYYEIHVDPIERDASLTAIAKHCGVRAATYKDAVTEDAVEHKKELKKHLLAHTFLQTMVKKAALLTACYTRGVVPTISATQCTALYEMTARRWLYASRFDGNAAIWFDSDQDFVPCSLERLGSDQQVDEAVPMLRLECEIESLLALLPDRYRTAVRGIDNALDRLVDINLDIGRVAHGYLGYRERVELDEPLLRRPSLSQWLSTRLQAVIGSTPSTTARLVDANDLATVLDRLGGQAKIGSDNRAGVDRQLHRISVMRDKSDAIFGLTMRVGRTLHFASNFLLDLLLSETHRHKSVLLLGRPGSGKTTLIRDIARCVSASGENVCIIDTSNEIGGDGLVPHACIGWARRMMVKSLNDQASVMVECVQNHTVETLIVDEIGRKAEVNAAGTVRQRGPRMIASAHGDLRSLIKNQDLKGLVGGVQSVIVGDKEAEKNSFLGKVQAKRAGNPIFDVIVELDEVHRGRCRIIWDVAQAVDDVLSGNVDYAFETRFQSFAHRGVQVLAK